MLNLYTDSSWYTGIKITVDRETSMVSSQLYFTLIYFVWICIKHILALLYYDKICKIGILIWL